MLSHFCFCDLPTFPFYQSFTEAPHLTRFPSRFPSHNAAGRGGTFPSRGRGGHAVCYKKVGDLAAPAPISSIASQGRAFQNYDIITPSQGQTTPEFIPGMFYNPQGALWCCPQLRSSPLYVSSPLANATSICFDFERLVRFCMCFLLSHLLLAAPASS